MKTLVLEKMKELGIRFNLKQVRNADKPTQIMLAINLYLAGYTPNHIMSISGHRSIQSFIRYVRASGTEVSDRLTRCLELNHKM